MRWWMFLDDVLTPWGKDEFDHWRPHRSLVKVATSVDEAIQMIADHGLPERMSLDGSLGWGPSGMDFLRWLKTNHRDYKGKIHCHSGNGNMAQSMSDFVEDVWGEDVLDP